MKRSRPFKETRDRILKDPKMAVGYLNTALEEGDMKAFLLALRNVAEARGGMSRLSRTAGMNRSNLYKMLSKRGRPEIQSLENVLKALGLRLSITPEEEFPLAKAA